MRAPPTTGKRLVGAVLSSGTLLSLRNIAWTDGVWVASVAVVALDPLAGATGVAGASGSAARQLLPLLGEPIRSERAKFFAKSCLVSEDAMFVIARRRIAAGCPSPPLSGLVVVARGRRGDWLLPPALLP
jgi:hypothetical protein